MSARGIKDRWVLHSSPDGKTHYIYDTVTEFNLAIDTDDTTRKGFRQIKQMAWAIINSLNSSDQPRECNPHK